MRKLFTRHDNLRKTLEEIHVQGEDVEDSTVERFVNEMKHSSLIIAADKSDDDINFRVFEHEGKDYGVLFTDMDEFRKSFSDEECESHLFDFELYKKMIELGIIEGFLINPESECFLLKKELFLEITDLPEHTYDDDNAYDAQELKRLYDNINNDSLESFIANPDNIGKYDELFAHISDSVMLTLMLSDADLTDYASNGVICMLETGPLAFLYIDEVGGQYSTLFTSVDKMSFVDTDLKKYSQIVNVSIMTNFVLNDDMDGIIINPGSDNVLLTRDILFEYSPVLEKTCNDVRLNSAIFHLFV
ncbi:SseB family protein [Methanobrevibacter sp.]